MARPTLLRPEKITEDDALRQEQTAARPASKSTRPRKGAAKDSAKDSTKGGAAASGVATDPSVEAFLPQIKEVVPEPPKELLPDTSVYQIEETERFESDDIVDKAAKGAPPWVISLIGHVIVILVLGLWLIHIPFKERPIELLVEMVPEVEEEEEEIYAEEEGQQLELDIETPELEEPPEENTEMVLEDTEVPDPAAAPELAETPAEEGTVASITKRERVPIGQLLNGRTPGGRKGLAGKYGGTKTTEEAMEEGLRWLVRQQLKDGSWSLLGPYSDGVNFENQSAATAMALIAFQGGGYTPETTKYKRTTQNGWKWLLKQQDAEGNFYNDGPYTHAFYTQSQCAIALCELYGMTKNKKYLEPAQRAISYLVKTQGRDGGWKYDPNTEAADMSVTGWVVMAFQSAKMAGIEVPQETMTKTEGFLDRIAQAGGTRYPYERNGDPTRTMTAEAILCRQYLGWEQDDPRMVSALDYVLSGPVNFRHNRDVYRWYYATQAMHHMEGRWWKEWNGVMRQEVPSHQVKSGREKGSWDPNLPTRDAYAHEAGRLYVTCLSIYMLQVYYRHLPIYANAFDAQGLPIPNDGEAKPEGATEGASEGASADGTPDGENPADAEDAGGDNADADAAS